MSPDKGATQRIPRSSALDTKVPSNMASFTFTAHEHTMALQPRPVLSQTMPLEASEEAGLNRAAVGGQEALQRLMQNPMLPSGGRLAGRQLALQPETNIIFRQSRWLPTWCDFTGSGGPLPNPKISPPPASCYSRP